MGRYGPCTLYILALLFVGLGYVSILPPFEGFDESAHYTGLRQVADVGTLPLRGRSFLPQDVAEYRGPVAYGSGVPPFDTGLVYKKFFADPGNAEMYRDIYRTPRRRPPYVESGYANWEAQHPPFYYVLLAPVLKATDGLSFVGEILVLRLTSFLLAMGGVALALLATRRTASAAGEVNSGAFTGFLIYPLVLPMFFFEFARMGNDSLCLLLTGASAFLMARLLRNESDISTSAALGPVLAIGLMTKALFIPIAGALLLFLLARLIAVYDDITQRRRRLRNLALIASPALVIGGAWYVYNLLTFGEWSGGNEALRLANSGGLSAALHQHFSISALARGLVGAVATWSWAGSWSLTRVNPLLQVPVLLTLLWVAVAFLMEIRKRPWTDPVWLPVYLCVVFSAGMLWHMMMSIALDGNPSTLGSYLHLLMPWTAPACGIGACAIARHSRQRRLLFGLLSYCVVFHAVALWAHFALFTGCAWKGDDKYFVFPDRTYCMDQLPALLDRLTVIGWPWLAVASIVGTAACGLGLIVYARRLTTSPAAGP